MKPTHDKLASVLKTGIFNEPYRSFKDLEKKISDLGKTNTTLEGNAFEVFVEAYLCTQADKQVQAFYQVGHIPKVWRDRLNLPNSSTGIDGLYIDRSGDPVLFQVKFLSGRPSVTWAIAKSFLGISDRCRKRFMISNSNDLVEEVKRRKVSAILGFQFDKLTPDDFKAIHHFLHKKRYQPKPYRPDPHQAQAVQQVIKEFKKEHRTQAIMACGTGKTFAALWVAEALKTKTVLVLLPSIALLSQTLKEWSKATSWGERFTYMAVCSDDTVGKQEDDVVLRPTDLDFPTSTDPKEIKKFIQSSSSNIRIVFSTYQSSGMVAKAMKGRTFDLGIFDEAHKTTGSKKTYFTEAHQDTFISIEKRLYMTATPRIYKINKKNKDGDFEVLSMDDPAIYGREAYKLSFGDAARKKIICNYKIVITTIDPRRLDPKLLPISKTLVKKEHLPSDWVAKSAALAQAIEETKAKRVITFHSRIKLAREFASNGPQGIQTHLKGFETFHVSGEDSASKRESDIEDFKQASKGLITNARCLTEGVDVPTVDMVAFMDPKKSTIDIAQAIGRAMRKPRGSSSKKIGYIFIPLLVESTHGKMTESSIEETDYKAIADVINAMQELDEDLKDIISEIRFQTGLTGQFNPRKLSEKISFSGNLNELSLKVIEKAVLNDVVDRIGESWDESFGKLKSFLGKYKKYPLIGSRGGPLGDWISKQRIAYNKKTLSPDRVKRLESLKGWSWDPFTDTWNEEFILLKKYIVRYRTYPQAQSGSTANWMFTQRSAYKKNTLSPDRVKRLESLPGWSWDPIAEAWNKNFELLKKYVAQYKAYPYTNSETLGGWIYEQRRKFKIKGIESDRVRKLESLPGWSWDPIAEAWNKNFELLKKYVAQHKAYPTESESLGVWLLNRRTNYKNKTLSPDQIRRLESLPGWSWDPITEAWNKNFELLKKYLAKHQGYPPAGSGSLGAWVSSRRTNYKNKTLSPDQIRRLESLPGWSWGRKKKN
jgi:superfamily II DNA or RNA helicase